MLSRLQKIIAASGVCSRRAAEELISQGRVTVNGAAAVLGASADPDTDVIAVDGKPIARKSESVYIMLHKPRGYVTTLSDEKGRPNVMDLVDCGTRVYPVGRLDMDSEGLLLLTNDGELANTLMHPSHVVDKVYWVKVSGFTQESEALLARPIELDGRPIAAPGVRLLMTQGERAIFEVTIHEGRNRQVRRMCKAAGLTVHRLRRVREGSLELGDLPLGRWRHLSDAECRSLGIG